jgi:hypothetical protein
MAAKWNSVTEKFILSLWNISLYRNVYSRCGHAPDACVPIAVHLEWTWRQIVDKELHPTAQLNQHEDAPMSQKLGSTMSRSG